MIVGIGVDTVSVSRVKEKVGADFASPFARGAYTDEEIEYARKKGVAAYQSLAGFFAAREAFFKATQVRLGWKDIAVHHEENGKPFFRFSDKGHLRLIEKGKDPAFHRFHLSITHERDYAVVVVVCEERV